jgi:hypothetical protein
LQEAVQALPTTVKPKDPREQPSECFLKQLALFEADDISATEMRQRVIRHAQRKA